MGTNRLRTGRHSLSRELSDDLRRRIVSGEFSPGSKLPSEAELGSDYEVSRVTVRAALQALEARGLADIRHGSGTFVSRVAGGIRAGLQELRSITETIRDMGHEPTMCRRAIELRAATDHEAAKLGIAPGDEVWSIERSVHADGEPVAYSHDVIATAVLAAPEADADGRVDLDGVSLGNDSVFGELERRGLELNRALAEIHAVAPIDLPWRLDERSSAPYLLLDQLHEGRHGEPILYSRTYFVEGKFQFVVLRTR